ncbi:MAG TPA: TIGR03118 family protein [Bryobacteraceae bacterium]|nr:TIGR03118 family protein [Bryobacteraceae bacterium]
MKAKLRLAKTISAFVLLTPAWAQTGNVYLQTKLVSNVPGAAAVTDPNLVDPWGISFSAGSPFWVSNHFSGTATLYNGQGAITPLVVSIPPGAAQIVSVGRPTGQVQNPTATAFLLPTGRASSFLFATEDGTIAGWQTGATAVTVVDNSRAGAVYKGLAIGTSAVGPTLYAANFRTGKVDVFDQKFAPVTLAGTFSDPAIPTGYAPFNIWNLGGSLYVEYALQDSAKFLDVAGAGNGQVSIFDLNGTLKTHLISGGALNSPWGVAIAPANWGAFGGALLVGNFGDGKINAFDLKTGNLLGTLNDAAGNPIVLTGLWAIVFGNGARADVNTLYFAAGVPSGSSVRRGLLGSLAPPATITSVMNAASELVSTVSPGEIVVIKGQTVGQSPLVAAAIGAPGTTLASTVNNTSVTVNGFKAPILYADGAQTAVQVPYEVAGSSSASFVVTTGVTTGVQTTPAFAVAVTDTAPGLFTIDFTGKGRAVALNSDGTVNALANPALRGSNMTLFATGEGVTTPASLTGVVQADNSKVPSAPIVATFNTVSSAIVQAGSFPKTISGVLQLQVTVPRAITPGVPDLAITIGGLPVQPAPVVYVK